MNTKRSNYAAQGLKAKELSCVKKSSISENRVCKRKAFFCKFIQNYPDLPSPSIMTQSVYNEPNHIATQMST